MKTKIIIYLGLSLILFGCNSYTQWQLQQEDDAPFVSETMRARAWVRDGSPPFLVIASGWSEAAWEIGNEKIKKIDIGNSIDRYLEKVGYIQSQKPIGSWINDVQDRVAEHRFFIVSLNPTLVIMTPYDFGDITRQSTSDLSGRFTGNVIGSSVIIKGDRIYECTSIGFIVMSHHGSVLERMIRFSKAFFSFPARVIPFG